MFTFYSKLGFMRDFSGDALNEINLQTYIYMKDLCLNYFVKTRTKTKLFKRSLHCLCVLYYG